MLDRHPTSEASVTPDKSDAEIERLRKYGARRHHNGVSSEQT